MKTALRWTVRLLALAALAIFAGRWLADPAKARMIDFNSFYMAAQAARVGVDLYDAKALNELAQGAEVRMYVFPYLYPPVLAHVAIPLGKLPSDRARLLWMVFNLAALVPIAILTALTVHRQLRGRRGVGGLAAGDVALLFTAALLFVLPFDDNIDMGQVNLLVLLFLSLAFFFLSRDREWAGGAMLGVAAVLKVSPAVLLLYFLARRRFRVVLSCLLSVAAIAAATLPLGAAGAWTRFFAVLPEMSHARSGIGIFPPGFYPNFAVAGLFARIFPDDLPLARIWTLALLSLLAAGLAFAVWRTATPQARNLLVSSFLVLMIVASPFAYRHHVIYLLPGAVLLLTDASLGFRPVAGIVWTGLLLGVMALAGAPFPGMYARWSLSPQAARFLTSLNLYALLLLMALGLAQTWIRRPSLRSDQSPT